jgi:hypothetical protein
MPILLDEGVAGSASSVRRATKGVRALGAPCPLIRPSGIRWTGGLNGVPLRLSLDFENPADAPTFAVGAKVEVAAFGAFVPWRPSTRVLVPAIPPGGRRTVRTAVGGEEPRDRPPPSNASRVRMVRLLRQMMRLCHPDSIAAAVPFGRAVHMVGNFNVHVDAGRPVERHRAVHVGLRPDAVNMGMFVVGNGSEATYRLDVDDVPPGWEVGLRGLEAPDGSGPDLTSRTEGWVRCRGFVRVEITPPFRAESGHVAIGVEHLEGRTRTQVEFDLETAHGPSKCYFL